MGIDEVLYIELDKRRGINLVLDRKSPMRRHDMIASYHEMEMYVRLG